MQSSIIQGFICKNESRSRQCCSPTQVNNHRFIIITISGGKFGWFDPLMRFQIDSTSVGPSSKSTRSGGSFTGTITILTSWCTSLLQQQDKIMNENATSDMNVCTYNSVSSRRQVYRGCEWDKTHFPCSRITSGTVTPCQQRDRWGENSPPKTSGTIYI